MSDDWYKRDIRAAIAGMTRLTLEERGAYNTIIDHQYLMGRGLADDDAYLAGLMGCDVRVWKRVKASLVAKDRIRISGGLIEDVRASYTIATRQVKRSQPVAKPDSAPKSPVTSNETNGLETTSPADSSPREEEKREEEVPRTNVRGARAKATRLPADFDPPTEEAIDAGLEPHRVPVERAKFLDHWRAAPGGRGLKQDWLATWRNWCRRAAADYRPSTGPPRNGRQTAGDYIREAMERLQEPPPDEPDFKALTAH